MPRAMVLAAGLGTRLRPLTNAIPKPLLPFGDRLLLEHAFRALKTADLGPDVVVNTHHLPEAFERAVPGFSLDVRFSHEPVLRGTAGGIAQARGQFDPGPLVVMTSDVVLERLPPDFRDSAAEDDVVLAVAPRPKGTGTIGIGARGEVVRLRGQVFGEEALSGDYVGLMVLGELALAEMPEWGCYIRDFALPRLARGGMIKTIEYPYGFVITGDDVRSYFDENLRWLDRERGGESYIGEGASVGPGVELRHSLVGAGARIEGEGCVLRSVIFPGEHCSAPLEEVLVAGAVIPITSASS